jgi:hypothetical protein
VDSAKQSPEVLLEQVLEGASPEQRHDAMVALVASDEWRLVLAPHVLSKQCYETNGVVHPDQEAFALLAPIIAEDEEKIHRVLELVGVKLVDELLLAVARHMRRDLVEHILDHLRTAEKERATALERALYEADPFWVREAAARRAIRNRLRTQGKVRIPVLTWLADAGNLGDFEQEVHEHPPQYLEEWSAVGRAQIEGEDLLHRALSKLGGGPEPLAYLLRLKPIPDGVFERLMAAAKPDWLLSGLEVAIMEGLDSLVLIPLAELAVRLGGRHMAAAVAWLNTARLGPRLLTLLASQMEPDGEKQRLSSMLWVNRRTPSANRALEHGRNGKVPDPLDAAALVRQLHGGRLVELVREILEKPRPEMMESVLRPLCGVHPEAAEEVTTVCESLNPDLARRAQRARAWPDVAWPELEESEEPPATFTPLGKGI